MAEPVTGTVVEALQEALHAVQAAQKRADDKVSSAEFTGNLLVDPIKSGKNVRRLDRADNLGKLVTEINRVIDASQKGEVNANQLYALMMSIKEMSETDKTARNTIKTDNKKIAHSFKEKIAARIDGVSFGQSKTEKYLNQAAAALDKFARSERIEGPELKALQKQVQDMFKSLSAQFKNSAKMGTLRDILSNTIGDALNLKAVVDVLDVQNSSAKINRQSFYEKLSQYKKDLEGQKSLDQNNTTKLSRGFFTSPSENQRINGLIRTIDKMMQQVDPIAVSQPQPVEKHSPKIK